MLLIANAGDDDPGLVGLHLDGHGAHWTVAHRESPGGWPGLEGVDLVLSLGSDWSVYWPDVAPSVEAEVALVRSAHRAGVPVLGICFGAQLAATALGGRVERSPAPELGWLQIDSRRPEVVAPGPWLQWHVDRVVLPSDVEPLASTAVAVQAFRVGRTVGVQFHPEVTSAIVERWVEGAGAAEVRAAGADPDELVARTRLESPRRREAVARLLGWCWGPDPAG